MAINNIKITTHDIFIEKDNKDKGGNLTVGENTTTNTLNVTGDTTNNGNLTVSKNINANGAIIGDGGLNVNTTTTTNTLNANTINISTNGGLTINGSNGNLTVAGTTNTNTLNVTKNTTTNTLSVNTINVTDNKNTLTLSVSNSKLNISGDLNVQGAITSSQNIVMSSINATGDLNVGTNKNSAHINVFGNISINDNIVLRQNDSKTEVIVGSNDKQLRLLGSNDRPSYRKNGESTYADIALYKDIPAVCNPTITIKQAGAEKGSFTLNQSGAKTIELTDTTYTAGTGLTLSDGKFSVNTGFSTNGTNYQVTTDTSGNLYVNVPWTNVATTSSNGLMSSTDKSKLEGIADNANNYLLPVATSEAEGGIKVGYSSNSQKYAVELDSDNKAYVSVPWTDNNTTYTAGTGLELSGTTFNIKTNYNTNEKNYKVTTDTSGNLYVNVPWTDNNTTYTAGTGLTLSDGKFSVNIQNNLTSDSTTDVLSAKQGKELKSQIDGKSAIGHDHDGRYLKIEDTGAVILSSGPLKINYDDSGDYAPSDNAKYRPFPGINSSDLDMFIFDTGISCFDNDSGESYQYSFPAKTGTFAMTSDLNSYLPLSGGTVTGIVDFNSIVNFSNELTQIAFNDSGHYVTNMICGSISTTVPTTTGSTNSVYVSFPTYNNTNFAAKGEGSWRITVTASGGYSHYIAAGIDTISNTGFRILIRTMGAVGSGGEMNFNYVAVKYY